MHGFCLNRDGSGKHYRPTLVLHVLSSPATDLSVSLRFRLKTSRSGVDESLPVPTTDPRLLEAIRRFRQQSPLGFEGALKASEVVGALKVEFSSFPALNRFELLRDAAHVVMWLGRNGEALELLRQARVAFAASPMNVKLSHGGEPAWLSTPEDALDRELLRARVAAEIQKHGLGGLESDILDPS